MSRVAVVDANDSFTYNLVQALSALGATVDVLDTFRVTPADLCGRTAVLLGPGPGAPAEAGAHVSGAAALIAARVPLLGVCLGMQAIGLAMGGRVTRVAARHGYTSPVSHTGTGLFAGLPSPVAMMRYHSLALEDAGLPSDLEVIARSDDGLIQAVQHRLAPTCGVQFHPESVGSEPWGTQLLATWLRTLPPALPP